MFRAARVLRDEGKIDVGRLLRREFALRFFGGFLKSLQRHRFFTKVDAGFLLEVVGEVVDENVVEVVASQVGVAVRADNFEDAVRHLQDGNVEGAAAEVEDDDLFVDARSIETVSKSRRRRFVYDTRDFQARDLPRVFRRLTLSVVEVSRHRNNRFIDFVSKVRFRSFLKFAKRLRGNLCGRIALAVDFNANVFVGSSYDFVRNHAFLGADFALFATHETLDRRDRALGVHDRLTFRKLSDELF